MRTVEFALPSLPVETWAKFERLYVVPPAESDLMQRSAAAGQRGYLKFDDFLPLARWKSPRPTKRYMQNSEMAAREVTTAAFACENDVEKVLELTRLTGINVRAATAILHLCFPNAYPLLDVRAMATFGLPDTETKRWDELQWLRVWKPYISLCRDLLPRSGLRTLRQLDRALWFRGTLTADQLDAMQAQRRADAESGMTVYTLPGC